MIKRPHILSGMRSSFCLSMSKRGKVSDKDDG
nr:MAG TPA: hypothetical protein [Caudoviricetes sp.]